MLKPRVQELFESYGEFHRHPVNQAIHKVAVPLIVFHVLAMLDWVVLAELGGFSLSLGHVLFAAALLWYLSLDLGLAVGIGLFGAACLAAARLVPPWLVIAVAVVAWTAQLLGHSVWEKRRPAFAQEPLQLLVGPLFILALLTGAWPRVVSGQEDTLSEAS